MRILPRRTALLAIAATAIAGCTTLAQDPTRVYLENLGERKVKQLYQACSDAAMEGRLSSGEIANCSIVYEVLLNQHFAGDFDALLTWSRGLSKK